MNKHISMKFDVVDEHIVDLKQISKRVGAVSHHIGTCSSTLKRGNNLSESLYRQTVVIRKNVDSINRSIIDAYLTLDRIRDLYYKTEKQNFTAITGKKPYEDMNLFEKIKNNIINVGSAVVVSISNCQSAIKKYLPGGEHWHHIEQALAMAVAGATAFAVLAKIMTAIAAIPGAPAIVVIGGIALITKEILSGGKTFKRFIGRVESWANSLVGNSDKVDAVNWSDLIFDFVKSFKKADGIGKYKNVINASEVFNDNGNVIGSFKTPAMITYPARTSLAEIIAEAFKQPPFPNRNPINLDWSKILSGLNFSS